jgi:xanthine dehydrogenase accessory factor
MADDTRPVRERLEEPSVALAEWQEKARNVHDIDGVLAQAAEWLERGEQVGLATVVRTWGSSPRPVGSKLAVASTGQFVGSVSGGCIEGAVITEALEVAAGRERPHVLAFGVSDETAWNVGLACGGKIEVYVEAASTTRIRELRDARVRKQPFAMLVPLDGREPELVAPGIDAHPTNDDAPRETPRTAAIDATPTTMIDDALRESISRALLTDEAFVVDTPNGAVLVEPHNPPSRLIIVGAVHVANPLAQMARLAGFAITIVDPRRAWATPERFPGDTLVTEWPDVAMDTLAIDTRTAVVALTHDPKIDDPGLVAALKSRAFYIGCLGSKKTHAARRERLGAKGFDTSALDRLRGPVGLDIGAKSPAEIAVSILAEVIAALRGRDPRAH